MEYCGHSVKSLTKITKALKGELVIQLNPTDDTPDIESEYDELYSPLKRASQFEVERKGKKYLQANQELEYKHLRSMIFEQLREELEAEKNKNNA